LLLPATETTRKIVTFGAATTQMVNDLAMVWTDILGSEDPTYMSFWDHLTAGNCWYTGAITAAAFTAGDNYTVAIGGVVVTLAVAA
jgi:hypothetical protein